MDFAQVFNEAWEIEENTGEKLVNKDFAESTIGVRHNPTQKSTEDLPTVGFF